MKSNLLTMPVGSEITILDSGKQVTAKLLDTFEATPNSDLLTSICSLDKDSRFGILTFIDGIDDHPDLTELEGDEDIQQCKILLNKLKISNMNVEELNNGDNILVEFEGLPRKAKFIRTKPDKTKFQATVLGKPKWVDSDAIIGPAQDGEGDKVEDAKALAEQYNKLISSDEYNVMQAIAEVGLSNGWPAHELHKLHAVLLPGNDHLKSGSDKTSDPGKAKMTASKGGKSKAASKKNEKKPAKAKKEAKEPAKKKEKADLPELAKSYQKRGKSSPLEFQEKHNLNRTEAIGVMLIAGEEPGFIKDELDLTIQQFVYNVRTKLIKDGLLEKPEKKKKEEPKESK